MATPMENSVELTGCAELQDLQLPNDEVTSAGVAETVLFLVSMVAGVAIAHVVFGFMVTESLMEFLGVAILVEVVYLLIGAVATVLVQTLMSTLSGARTWSPTEKLYCVAFWPVLLLVSLPVYLPLYFMQRRGS